MGFYFALETLSSRLLPVDEGILYGGAKKDKAALPVVRPPPILIVVSLCDTFSAYKSF